MKRVLVTGASGFVGPYLIKELLSQRGHTLPALQIFGTKRWRSTLHVAKWLDVQDDVHWLDMHLEDQQSVKKTIQIAQPDWVFHLAAQSFVPSSFEAEDQTYNTNLIGTVHLLAMLRDFGSPDVRIQICGTSEEYGKVRPDETPITEENILRPCSPYGIAKVAMEHHAHMYRDAYGMHIVVTRAFNHEGAGRPSVFAPSDWCRQAVQVLNSQRDNIIHGNLDAVRDYLDVKDVVRGYIAALLRGDPRHPYNICSGTGMTMKSVLQQICDAAELEGQYVLRQDPKRFRPSEVPLLIGDSTRIREETGWEPEVSFTQTIHDMLAYWRNNL